MTQGTRLKQIVKLVTRQAAFQTCHLISVQLWQWRGQSAALWFFSLCPWGTLHIEHDMAIPSTRNTSWGTANSAPCREAGGGCSWGRAHPAPQCKAGGLKGQLGWMGSAECHCSTCLAEMQLGRMEERNGSTTEQVKSKVTKMWTLKFFPLLRMKEWNRAVSHTWGFFIKLFLC